MRKARSNLHSAEGLFSVWLEVRLLSSSRMIMVLSMFGRDPSTKKVVRMDCTTTSERMLLLELRRATSVLMRVCAERPVNLLAALQNALPPKLDRINSICADTTTIELW